MTTIDAQIAELKREIALRKNVYPGFVERGKLKQESSDRQIANMTAALHTVMAVKRLRETIAGHLLQGTECGCGWRPKSATQEPDSGIIDQWIDHLFERSKADASQ